MKNLFFIVFTLALLPSCSDFLEVEPDEQISINEQLSTKEGVQAAVSGIYSDLESLLSSKVFVYPDVMSGNLAFSPTLSNGLVTTSTNAVIGDTYSFDNTAEDSEFNSIYSDAYNIINQLNLLLERTADFNFLSTSELDQLQAEMLAVRAFTHYHLSLLFAQNINFTNDGSHLGIVYNQRRLRAGLDFPARVTSLQTYEFLKQDLDQALSLFTETQILPVGSQKSYFNPLTTKTVYAKIALQNNDWQKAADLAGDIISTSGLMLTPQSDYITQWELPNDLTETILSFSTPRDSDGSVSSSISIYYRYIASNNYKDLVASGDLLDLFEPRDIRLELYQAQSLPTATVNGRENRDYFFTTKYQLDNETLYTRLSDMYLIQAEALERLTPGNVLALQRLNDIRERAGIDALPNSNGMLENIFLERRREFAFESSTFYDLIRYKKDILRNQGCIANPCNLNYPSPFYILPIPLNSIINNENMIQNEGY